MLRTLRWQIRKLIYRKKLACLNALRAKYALLNEVLQASGKYEIDLLIRPYAHLNAKKEVLKRLENDLIHFQQLLDQKAQIGDFKVFFIARPKVISEGLFSMQINFKEQGLYLISFSIVDEVLLITCAQGLANSALLKEATKAGFNLRPINLALHLMSELSSRLNLKLAGVKNKSLISGFKKAKFEFIDYDKLWAENASLIVEKVDFYELEIQRKELEQIASKKRSEYKKRYALMDEIIKELYENR